SGGCGVAKNKCRCEVVHVEVERPGHDVNHGPRGTAVHAGGGTAVHTDHNWNDVYWHTNRYGYWHGQRGYWTVRGGKHVFVVVQ
ncbi:MAG TPA: hypothetical protein VNY04_09590, partial [Chthoniobacterales bacterium]|nr:hypothetical protein [Chthoniobacterales bacterium]